MTNQETRSQLGVLVRAYLMPDQAHPRTLAWRKTIKDHAFTALADGALTTGEYQACVDKLDSMKLGEPGVNDFWALNAPRVDHWELIHT